MTTHIELKQLTTMNELRQMQEVEAAVWQISSNPVHQTFTVTKHGGIILGAFHNQKMIGFLYSFPGFDGERTYLCSHMMGILPEYRKGGLGEKLKRKQAELAAATGYSIITWTFDPLESLNAYLNLHKLGAIGAHYRKNHYGLMDDELNQGLPTDRFQVEWDICSDRYHRDATLDENRLLVRMDENRNPTDHTAMFDTKHDDWFVEIPTNFQEIKASSMDLAKAWRTQTTSAFDLLFNNGFIAQDVLRDPDSGRCYYYFTKQSSTI